MFPSSSSFGQYPFFDFYQRINCLLYPSSSLRCPSLLVRPVNPFAPLPTIKPLPAPPTASSSTPTRSKESPIPVDMDENAENLFKNVVISVCGHFRNRTHGQLKVIVEKAGATFSGRVTESCTHLITTPREVQFSSFKAIQAQNAYCEIVSLGWLLSSVEAGKPLPEATYLITLTTGNNADGRTSVGQVIGMKRLLVDDTSLTENTSSKRTRLGALSKGEKVIIPAHTACSYRSEYSVMVDRFGHVWDAMLVKSAAQGKSNHYCHLQLLVHKSNSQYMSWGCWGRIGEGLRQLQCSPCGLEDAKEDFEFRFLDKTGISWGSRFWDKAREDRFRYTESKSYSRNPDDDPFSAANASNITYHTTPLACSRPEAVQKVVAMIFNKSQLLSAKASTEYDVRKLPLGRLSKQTLVEGYEVLKELSDLIKTSSLDPTASVEPTGKLSSQYFTIIPHVFGKNKPPLMCTERHIEKEMTLLDELANALIANDIISCVGGDVVHPLDQMFDALCLQEMKPVKRNSNEFLGLRRYFNTSVSPDHYKIIDAFRIRRVGEEARFRSSQYAKLPKSNRQLLWHGSSTTNFAGILREGLQVRPAGVTIQGDTWGRGVYLSDAASVSSRYHSARSGVSSTQGLLLLCDVELGDPINSLSVASVDRRRKKGAMSTIMKHGCEYSFWRDASEIHYSLAGLKYPDYSVYSHQYTSKSEYVVFDVAQIQIRYLLVVEKK